MGKALTKSRVVAELASMTQLDKKQVAELLDAMTELACREAVNGFTIPGICKLKIVTRKPTHYRNPATKQLMQIGERNVLKVMPLKSIRDRVTPRPENLMTVLDESTSKKPASPAVAPPQVAVEEPQSPGVAAETATAGQILFECEGCRSTLSASPTEAGMQGTCPYCEHSISVPEQRAPLGATSDTDGGSDVGGKSSSGAVDDFVFTTCETCGQEIEAPSEMIGMEVNCPSCSAPLQVPARGQTVPAKRASQPSVGSRQSDDPDIDLSSMTIRIDLSDLE